MGKSRSKSQITRDRRKIAQLYLQMFTQTAIAEKMGIDQSTVSRDLKVIQADWAAETIHDINERKNIELAKVDALELEYWKAWERSQAEAVEKIQKSEIGSGGNLAPAEATIKRKNQVGDARFLDGVMKCIDKRCKILGIDAPVKFEGKQLIGVVGLGVDTDLI